MGEILYKDESYKLVEMKAVSTLTSSHEAQVMNYLKATGCRLGLLFNFGADSFQYRRLVK